MEKFYLRNHLGDHSHMRDWTMHRMLRMHRMPFLRTRTAKLYVNAVFVGTYSLMESADQDYVFYRNFGQGDANSPSSLPPFAPGHALYKIKTQSRNCGKYETRGSGGKDSVANAQPPIYTAPTDPSLYAFKRGEHRQKVAVHVGDDMTKCLPEFYGMIIREERDAIAAWLKNGKDCGEMVIENGLVDRDFGGSNTANDNDGRMKSFFNTYLANGAADGCGGACDSDDNAGGNIYAQLRSTKVNVDDLLKNFAVYAVTVGVDRPIAGGNNYFLASPGGDTAAERAYRITTTWQEAPAWVSAHPSAKAGQSTGVSRAPPARRSPKTLSSVRCCRDRATPATCKSMCSTSRTSTATSTPTQSSSPKWKRTHPRSQVPCERIQRMRVVLTPSSMLR